MIKCNVCGEKIEEDTNLEFIICPSCNVEWRVVHSDFCDEIKFNK